MEQVYAEYNYARWIVKCPKCLLEGIQSAMEVKPGDIFVCPEEHPNILATALVPNPRINGAFNSVADLVLRAETRQAAIAAGEAYEVIFPEEKAEIERILRVRTRDGRNWWQGVPLTDLIAENIERGVPNA
jgi:hypothetical protein